MFKYLNDHHLGGTVFEFAMEITEVVLSVLNVLYCPCIILFIRMQLNVLITVVH